MASDDLEVPCCGVGRSPDDPTGRIEGVTGGEVAPFVAGIVLKGLREGWGGVAPASPAADSAARSTDR